MRTIQAAFGFDAWLDKIDVVRVVMYLV